MTKRKTSESQKERNKKGEDRMEKFEEKVKVEPIVKTTTSTDEYEEYTVTAYQKIDPGEWEKVEIPYKRKKR
jgi:hypothetical protein